MCGQWTVLGLCGKSSIVTMVTMVTIVTIIYAHMVTKVTVYIVTIITIIRIYSNHIWGKNQLSSHMRKLVVEVILFC